MAIYQAIEACPNYVTILNYTHARSMSSLIFLAADWRAMLPYSTYMFHEGTWGFEGTVRQARTEFVELQKAHEQMNEARKERGLSQLSLPWPSVASSSEVWMA